MQPLFDNLPSDAQSFEFDFRTRDQFIKVEVEGLHAPNPNELSQQEIKGMLRTADFAETDAWKRYYKQSRTGANCPYAGATKPTVCSMNSTSKK